LNNAAATDYWLNFISYSKNDTNTKVRSRASGGLGDIYILLSKEDQDGAYIKGEKEGLE
jgi:hypothetical protein